MISGGWMIFVILVCFFFFFNDTATTEIYTLSLHDALPIFRQRPADVGRRDLLRPARGARGVCRSRDRKSTRLNSSHSQISYAVFCLKKKKIQTLTSSSIRQHHYVTLATRAPRLSRRTCTAD